MRKLIIILISIFCLSSCVKYTVCYEINEQTYTKTMRGLDWRDFSTFAPFVVVKSGPSEYALCFDSPCWNGAMFDKVLVKSESPIKVNSIYKKTKGILIRLRTESVAYVGDI